MSKHYERRPESEADRNIREAVQRKFDTREEWRTAGIEAQDRAELQAQIDRLKVERDTRIHRTHAALLMGAAFIAGGIFSSLLLVAFHG